MSLTTPPGRLTLIRYKGDRQMSEKDYDWEKSSSYDSGRPIPIIVTSGPPRTRTMSYPQPLTTTQESLSI